VQRRSSQKVPSIGGEQVCHHDFNLVWRSCLILRGPPNVFSNIVDCCKGLLQMNSAIRIDTPLHVLNGFYSVITKKERIR
jgi:hypothetical protein